MPEDETWTLLRAEADKLNHTSFRLMSAARFANLADVLAVLTLLDESVKQMARVAGDLQDAGDMLTQ